LQVNFGGVGGKRSSEDVISVSGFRRVQIRSRIWQGSFLAKEIHHNSSISTFNMLQLLALVSTLALASASSVNLDKYSFEQYLSDFKLSYPAARRTSRYEDKKASLSNFFSSLSIIVYHTISV